MSDIRNRVVSIRVSKKSNGQYVRSTRVRNIPPRTGRSNISLSVAGTLRDTEILALVAARKAWVVPIKPNWWGALSPGGRVASVKVGRTGSCGSHRATVRVKYGEDIGTSALIHSANGTLAEAEGMALSVAEDAWGKA